MLVELNKFNKFEFKLISGPLVLVRSVLLSPINLQNFTKYMPELTQFIMFQGRF
ncbi:hypothetical protein SAMN05216283_10965 [Sunxiuqinia elliptica]|uniref:Uncharacterized protein n=1 Tax=Sunxiuqinia elliptica TaxID=655355 RepID=A0A1I2JLN6_9BACT|nr:hypothetical protein SAMN05216283_10965 [Sunxiuqinia elliptica]